LAVERPKPAETPEVMKRRVRTFLKSARERAGLTQRQVATELGYSSSKMIRMEQGLVPVSTDDVVKLMELYGVSDAETQARMADLARGSRAAQPWNDFKDSISATELSYYGNEPSASVIYKYEPTFVPGIFQTAEYAEALLTRLGLSKDEVLQKLELRLARTRILEERARPDMRFIIGEAVLSRPVGSLKVMEAQLRQLRNLATQPGVSLQILPFSVGPHRAMGDAFTIMTFDQEEVPDLLFLQDAGQQSTERDEPKSIRRYLDIFSELSDLACATEDFGDVFDTLVKKQLGIEVPAA
jgi:transcriptional regulator with XRE-family HTH domain